MAKIDNVVFISNHNIQLIQGSCDSKDMLRVDDYFAFPLEEGIMINGLITDEQELVNTLEKLKEYKVNSARVVIDSGQIITKQCKVPRLKHKELSKIIEDELSDVAGKTEELIYDYSGLKDFEDETKSSEVLCCAVERKLMKSYIDVFEKVGIKIQSVDISTNVLHKLTQEISELDGKTYIVSILDGNNISSYLFEDNHYTFSNRSRIFSDRGTEKFSEEMEKNISQLLQFIKSKQSVYTIGNVYFCGLKDSEKEIVFDRIKNSLKIETLEFPESSSVYVKNQQKGFKLNQFIFPVASLIRK